MVVFTNCVEYTLQQNHNFIPPIMLSEIQSNTTGPFDSLVSGNQMSAPFAKERIGFCAHFDQRFKRCFGRGHVRYMSAMTTNKWLCVLLYVAHPGPSLAWRPRRRSNLSSLAVIALSAADPFGAARNHSSCVGC